MKYPILMADIIKSRQKSSNLLMLQFKELTSTINNQRKKNLISPLTITLGDEFQGIIDSTANGVEIIFEIEELILKNNYDMKLRFVLFYGEIETNINNKIAYEMLGEGLTNARERLNELKETDFRFSIKLDYHLSKSEEYVNKTFFLYQNLVDSWKYKDYNIVSKFLEHDDYKLVAEDVHLNKSSTWRREKSLNIQEYKIIKEIILFIINTAV